MCFTMCSLIYIFESKVTLSFIQLLIYFFNVDTELISITIDDTPFSFYEHYIDFSLLIDTFL